MDGNQYDVAGVKERLNDYREKEREIDNQIERLERLNAKMTGAGIQELTDMPRAPSASTDRMSDYVAQKEELEADIREGVKEQSEERRRIERILGRLRHSDERAVIRIRYFDRESWNIVTELMFGSKADFDEKRDTYLRRVHKIHGSALLNMSYCTEADGCNPAIPAAM